MKMTEIKTIFFTIMFEYFLTKQLKASFNSLARSMTAEFVRFANGC